MSCIETRPLKERPYHRHTLTYFFKLLDSIEENVNMNLNAKKYGRDMYSKKNDAQMVETYNGWIENGLRKLQCLWNLKKAVNKVMVKFKCVTVGYYSGFYSQEEIFEQADEIIRYLSSVTRNSFDYEKIVEFEEVLKEASQLYKKFYETRRLKEKEIKNRIDELTPKVEFNMQPNDGDGYEKYKKFIEIAKTFVLTEDDLRELEQYWELIFKFSRPVSMVDIHNYQHTIDTLKKLKEEIEERLERGNCL